MKYLLYVLLFFLYIIFYVMFSIVFEFWILFQYFLNILLIFIPIYLLYKTKKENKKKEFNFLIAVIILFLTYIFQYNFLKIPEYPENFYLEKPNIVPEVTIDCRIKSCNNEEKYTIINNVLEWNILFNSPKWWQKIILNEENKDLIKNIDFNKEVVFKKFLYHFIYDNNHGSQKSSNDLFFNKQQFQEYKKSYSYYIYEKILNNNENSEILNSFKIKNNWFLPLFINKKNYYNSSLYSQEIFENMWNKLWEIEIYINSLK